MDHEVIPIPCKTCDWMLKPSKDHFDLPQGKNVKVSMKFKVPKRHILRPTLSIDMFQRFCSGRGIRGALVEKKTRALGKETMLEYFMNEIVSGEEKTKTRENKRIVKLDLILFQFFFLGI
jgi:hypothetical protein